MTDLEQIREKIAAAYCKFQQCEMREKGECDPDKCACFVNSILSLHTETCRIAVVRDIDGISDYDAGLLNDWGGGNVGWWQDYLRVELARCNDYWQAEYPGIVEVKP